MKRLFTLSGFLLFTFCLFAQAPSKMKFQTIIRNSSNKLVVGSTVGMRISILKGSATGISVYVETQTPVTDVNGMVSIEIGTGTVASGNFNTITWSSGQYYIKTEADPSGGSNYTIIGTTQLLSVPYAFYASYAGNSFDGNYNDLVNKPKLFDSSWTSIKGKPNFVTVASSGSYTDLSNKPVLATVATTGSYTDLLNKPKLFDSSWALIKGKPSNIVSLPFAPPKGYLIYFNGSNWDTIPKGKAGQVLTLESGIPVWKTSKISGPAHHLGESFGGGYICYVDSTGSHGYILSTVDISAGTVWSNINSVIIGVSAESVWDGFSNCSAITAQAGHTTSAALLCRIYMGGGYSDWYLPAIDQMVKINMAKFELDKVLGTSTLNNWYWSSTEVNATSANVFSFMNSSFASTTKNSAYRVRAIRNF